MKCDWLSQTLIPAALVRVAIAPGRWLVKADDLHKIGRAFPSSSKALGAPQGGERPSRHDNAPSNAVTL
jgi:hypothetical protein